MSWRLDYQVRSGDGGREKNLIYYVSLKVAEGVGGRNVERTIDFEASPEEMVDLLSKVKDAVKQVDRLTSRGSA